MPESVIIAPIGLDPAKFQNPLVTADGSKRASVALRQLEILWFNTGTLCNLACENCYIESSPTNDRLEYLSLGDVKSKLNEIRALELSTREIGFTGGEPFMNPEIIAMLTLSLDRGFDVLVLTNAMRPMQKHQQALKGLILAYDRIFFRISLDHYGQELHERERGANTWLSTIRGLKWLSAMHAKISVAGRMCWGEGEDETRKGYGRLFKELDILIDSMDPSALLLFPEMETSRDVPEITEACWGILGKSPDQVMCSNSRMVVRQKGEESSIVACTLLPYDPAFNLGNTLSGAVGPVQLNHPYCAQFCVLGGASCSS
jgi:uncharacterized Fe-S cluster-containing radical SAM superfamily protein